VKKTIFGAMTLAALAAIAVPGASARESFSTGVELLGDGEAVGDNFLLHGYLTSEKGKCRGNRKMQMLVDPGPGFEVRDTGQSTKNGAWALQGDISDATAIRAKALAKVLPNGDVCKGESQFVAF
jgi:hypothetical protein